MKKIDRNKTTQRNRIGKVLTLLLPPLLLIMILLGKEAIIRFAFSLPPCPFKAIYNFYCPSCGNTRSVSALLHGDLLTSLRYNIIPVLLLLFGLLAYIEIIAYRFGRSIKILPRNSRYYVVGAILLGVYLVIRNFIPYLTP